MENYVRVTGRCVSQGDACGDRERSSRDERGSPRREPWPWLSSWFWNPGAACAQGQRGLSQAPPPSQLCPGNTHGHPSRNDPAVYRPLGLTPVLQRGDPFLRPCESGAPSLSLCPDPAVGQCW